MATSSESVPIAPAPSDAPAATESRPPGSTDLLWTLILLLAVALFGITATRASWLCDDAYITFRSVDNLVNGYGPVWNTHERVQAFTHPLWMGLVSVVYFFTREVYVTVQVLGLFLSLAAVVLLGVTHARNLAAGTLAVIACMFSRAFVDYSTSGLENPLTHVLLVLFAIVWFSRIPGGRTVFWLSLLTGLAALNRMDAVLLFAPCLAVALVQARSWRALPWALLGMAPFLLWLCFATWYYGAPFPNTAYAKLNTGVPPNLLMAQGLAYYVSVAVQDPITLVVLAAGLATPLLMRDWRALPLAVGAFFYALYVVRIGGDFMVGRFLSAPFFVACLLIARLPLGVRSMFPAAAAIVLLGYMAPYPTVTSGIDYGSDRRASRGNEFRDERGVSDQRGFYYASTGLLRGAVNGWTSSHNWADFGENLEGKADTAQAGERLVRTFTAIGFVGYESGPEPIIVDYFALADPLLARLPMRPGQAWQIGHFRRQVPAGYLDSLRTGENLIENPDLHSLYDTIRMVTQGPLFSLKRSRAIWELHFGDTQREVDAYMARTYGAEVPEAAVPAPAPEASAEGEDS